MGHREEISKLKEKKSHLASRLGLEPTPAYQLRAPPSVSSQGSATLPPPSIHSTSGPAISSWLQSLIPLNSTGITDAGSEAIPSRAPSVNSDAGSHASNKGNQGMASPTAQHNWFQGLLPQANMTEQPLAMPWGNFL